MKIRTIIFTFLALLPLVGFSQKDNPNYEFYGALHKLVIKQVYKDGSVCVDSVCADSLETGFVCLKKFHCCSLLWVVDTQYQIITREDTANNKRYSYTFFDGKFEKLIVTTFDNYKLPVKEVCYIPCDDGKSYDTFYAGSLNEISYSYSFVYGKNNKLIQTIEYNYDAEGISQKTVRFLNIDGKPTKVQQFDPDDELVNEIVMKYDKHGNLTKKVTTFYNLDEEEKHTDEFKYKYDKYGNWVEKQFFSNGEWYMTTSRTLEYDRAVISK